MNTTNEEIIQETKYFSASTAEILCVIISFFAAYWYCNFIGFDPFHDWQFCAVVLILAGITEVMNRGKIAPKESYVWLGCYLLCAVSAFFALGRVWDSDQKMLFIHIFFVWWVLCRSGALLENQSGHLLPADAVNGFVRIPFGNFFLRIRMLACLFKSRKKDNGKPQKRWMILAAVFCLVLFVLATSLLMRADDGFASLLDGFIEIFKIDFDKFDVLIFILSLPVGAWLFGLMGGSARFSRTEADRQRDGVYAFLEKIRRVPATFWIAAVLLFSALYIVFFILQGSYLFGAFTRTLPEGFIVSEYARQGFFELCKVMTVNFSVLWLVTRMADDSAKNNKAFLAACTVLLAESMLFAVIAFSKLALYISCFGFTPLRLQSTWLVCVLFAGCIFWMVTIYTGKAVFRKWMLFGALTLTALTVI